jgi:hypothetical protein
MMGMVGLGVCVAAEFLLLSRYTAPACDADIVTSKLLPQLSAETGLSGLYLLNTQDIGGGLLAGTRRCVVAAQSYLAGPVTPFFKAEPNT